MSEKCWFFIIVGYLAGSIRFGYYLPKYFSHVDVTKVSQDGNPGAANAFQYGGILVGIAVLLGDMAKGFLPVRAALAAGIPMTIPLFTFVMAAPVLGHAYPFGILCREEKAIAVSFGGFAWVVSNVDAFVDTDQLLFDVFCFYRYSAAPAPDDYNICIICVVDHSEGNNQTCGLGMCADLRTGDLAPCCKVSGRKN